MRELRPEQLSIDSMDSGGAPFSYRRDSIYVSRPINDFASDGSPSRSAITDGTAYPFSVIVNVTSSSDGEDTILQSLSMPSFTYIASATLPIGDFST